MDKKLYAKARYPLYMAFLSIFLMIIILFVQVKWIVVGGLFSSFVLSLLSIVYGIAHLRFIGKNDAILRGESISWIGICLGVIAMFSTLPFVIALALK